MNARPRCAAVSRSLAEDPVGTAERVDTWLLQEYAAPWVREPLDDPRLPFMVRDRALRFLRGTKHGRVVFIRRDGEARSEPEAFVAMSTADHPHLCRIVGDVITPMLSSTDELMFLVCTHGQHDPCCGTFGYSVYRTLREIAPSAAWQCSHIGGDRFAANIVVLPWGLYYGHIYPGDVESMVSNLRAGQLPLQGLRGRSTLPRIAQVAEVYARRACAVAGLPPLRVVSVEQPAQSVWHVTLLDHTSRYAVELLERQSADARRLTCAAEEEGAPREYELLSCQRASR